MTPEEFALWFLGFSDAVKGRPTREQWETFKEKHAEVVAGIMKKNLLPPPPTDPYADWAQWKQWQGLVPPPPFAPQPYGPGQPTWEWTTTDGTDLTSAKIVC